MRAISILSLLILVTLGACKKEEKIYFKSVNDLNIVVEMRDTNGVARTEFDSTEHIIFIFHAYNPTNYQIRFKFDDKNGLREPNAVGPFTWYYIYHENGELYQPTIPGYKSFGSNNIRELDPRQSYLANRSWYDLWRADKWGTMGQNAPFEKGKYYLKYSFRAKDVFSVPDAEPQTRPIEGTINFIIN